MFHRSRELVGRGPCVYRVLKENKIEKPCFPRFERWVRRQGWTGSPRCASPSAATSKDRGTRGTGTRGLLQNPMRAGRSGAHLRLRKKACTTGGGATASPSVQASGSSSRSRQTAPSSSTRSSPATPLPFPSLGGLPRLSPPVRLAPGGGRLCRLHSACSLWVVRWLTARGVWDRFVRGAAQRESWNRATC